MDDKKLEQLLIDEFNLANLEVAKLCNHQKNVSKNYKNMISKINDKIKILKDKKNEENIKDSVKIKIKEQIEKLKRNKKNKELSKNLSSSTSKTNYIDPRIIFVFIKKLNLPPEKFFSKVLIEKYLWAQNVDVNYEF